MAMNRQFLRGRPDEEEQSYEVPAWALGAINDGINRQKMIDVAKQARSMAGLPPLDTDEPPAPPNWSALMAGHRDQSNRTASGFPLAPNEQPTYWDKVDELRRGVRDQRPSSLNLSSGPSFGPLGSGFSPREDANMAAWRNFLTKGPVQTVPTLNLATVKPGMAGTGGSAMPTPLSAGTMVGTVAPALMGLDGGPNMAPAALQYGERLPQSWNEALRQGEAPKRSPEEQKVLDFLMQKMNGTGGQVDPMNQAQADLAKALERGKLMDRATYAANNPRTTTVQTEFIPARQAGGFSQQIQHPTHHYDDLPQQHAAAMDLQEKALDAKRESDVIEFLGRKFLGDEAYERHKEMATLQHGFDLEKVREEGKLRGELARSNDPLKLQMQTHMAERTLNQMDNPNLPQESRDSAATQAIKMGLVDRATADQSMFNKTFEQIATDPNTKGPRTLEAAIDALAARKTPPSDLELKAVYRMGKHFDRNKLQAIINNEMGAQGYRPSEGYATPYGVAKQSYQPASNIFEKMAHSAQGMANLVRGGYNMTLGGGMGPGTTGGNRVLIAQFLGAMQANPEMREQWEKRTGMKLD